MSWARLAEMFNVDPKVNQSQEEGAQEGGVDVPPRTESPHRLSSVYSLRSFSTALDDYQECRSLSHLDILMPVYLIPLLALGLKLLLGLFPKIVVMSMVIVSVNVAERAGFLGGQTAAQ
ncbi:uncharacterized protein LOC142803254 [Rhipicephalus microplus]|uniref:uncharacterized protein LOC142803254 n=1 Tax=Rhipicephalus microplus TaxID=6941 RepID=UPI003F6B4EC9